MKTRWISEVIFLTIAVWVLVHRYYFSREARVKRGLAKVPRGRLGGLAAGKVVKLVGRLDYAAEPVVAPLSGRKCAYFQFTIEEWRHRGRSGEWVPIVEQTSHRDFVVRDGKTAALVRTADAEVALHKDEQDATGILGSPTPELTELLATYGQDATGLLGFNRRLRIREGVLEAGEHVAVCGVAQKYSGAPLAVLSGSRVPPVQWVFEPYGETKLYVSDDPASLMKPRAS